MKTFNIILTLFLFITPFQLILGSSEFNKNFTGETLRIDYYHSGNSKSENFMVDKLYREKVFSGNRNHLVSPFRYGIYRYEVYDAESGELQFSKGFDTYFGEYSTTDAANKGLVKTFHESAIIPFPKRKIDFKIKKKERSGKFKTYYSLLIDPTDIHISDESRYENVTIFKRGREIHPGKSLNIAIIAEGYTLKEKKKFVSDLEKTILIFFSQKPYSKYKDRIVFYGLFKPSKDRGTDEPRQKRFKNTVLETTFNSLDSPRYLLTEANRKLRDIASAVPYDVILIMVNSGRYGGGGIFNLYCTFTAGNKQTPYLLLHEFGHSFAGLADEYYSSSVSYNDFYPKGIEPDEPNITALLSKNNLKWKDMVTPDTELPTMWDKKKFDSLNKIFSKKRAEINRGIEHLIRDGAPQIKIDNEREKLNKLINEKEKNDRNFFRSSKNRGIVGAFEGAGYSSKGLFRPMTDCIMFTIGKKPYCRVCRSAVEKMILYYIK